MEDLDVLFSDKFVEFARKIAEIADAKKKEKQEFEKLYEDFRKKMKEYDDKAKKLQVDFEKWKKVREENVGDG